MELEVIKTEEEIEILADENLYMEIGKLHLEIFFPGFTAKILGVPVEIGKWIKKNKQEVLDFFPPEGINPFDGDIEFEKFKKAVKPPKKREKKAEEIEVLQQGNLSIIEEKKVPEEISIISGHSNEIKDLVEEQKPFENENVESILSFNEKLDIEIQETVDSLNSELARGEIIQAYSASKEIKVLSLAEREIILSTIEPDFANRGKYRTIIAEINHWLKTENYVYSGIRRFEIEKDDDCFIFSFDNFEIVVKEKSLHVHLKKEDMTKLIYFRVPNDCVVWFGKGQLNAK
jgi:hypothetical protein